MKPENLTVKQLLNSRVVRDVAFIARTCIDRISALEKEAESRADALYGSLANIIHAIELNDAAILKGIPCLPASELIERIRRFAEKATEKDRSERVEIITEQEREAQGE
ncbi:MAG: hypothetical protein LBE22_10555 [Azoarcus sp.]|nr:hypothetical protein [Azoarcus sp.]